MRGRHAGRERLLVLPRILRIEIDEATLIAEAGQLEKERRLDGAAGVGVHLATVAQRVQQSRARCYRLIRARFRLVSIREERVLHSSRGMIHPCPDCGGHPRSQ